MERIIMHVDVNNAFLSWSAVYYLQNGLNVDIRTIPHASQIELNIIATKKDTIKV